MEDGEMECHPFVNCPSLGFPIHVPVLSDLLSLLHPLISSLLCGSEPRNEDSQEGLFLSWCWRFRCYVHLLAFILKLLHLGDARSQLSAWSNLPSTSVESEFHSYHFANRASFTCSFFSTGGAKLNIHKPHLSCDGLGKHRECSWIRSLGGWRGENSHWNPHGRPQRYHWHMVLTRNSSREETTNVHDNSDSIIKNHPFDCTFFYTSYITSKVRPP